MKVGDRVKHKLTSQLMIVLRDHNKPVYTLLLEVPEPYTWRGQEITGDKAICHEDNLELFEAESGQLKIF